jgi:hypothetical protein
MRVMKEDSHIEKVVQEIEELMKKHGVSLQTGVCGEMRLHIHSGTKEFIFCIRDTDLGYNETHFPRLTDSERLGLIE